MKEEIKNLFVKIMKTKTKKIEIQIVKRIEIINWFCHYKR